MSEFQPLLTGGKRGAEKKNAVCMKVEVLTRKIGFKFGNFCWQKIRTSETAAKTQKKKKEAEE